MSARAVRSRRKTTGDTAKGARARLCQQREFIAYLANLKEAGTLKAEAAELTGRFQKLFPDYALPRVVVCGPDDLEPLQNLIAEIWRDDGPVGELAVLWAVTRTWVESRVGRECFTLPTGVVSAVAFDLVPKAPDNPVHQYEMVPIEKDFLSSWLAPFLLDPERFQISRCRLCDRFFVNEPPAIWKLWCGRADCIAKIRREYLLDTDRKMTHSQHQRWSEIEYELEKRGDPIATYLREQDLVEGAWRRMRYRSDQAAA